MRIGENHGISRLPGLGLVMNTQSDWSSENHFHGPAEPPPAGGPGQPEPGGLIPPWSVPPGLLNVSRSAAWREAHADAQAEEDADQHDSWPAEQPTYQSPDMRAGEQDAWPAEQRADEQDAWPGEQDAWPAERVPTSRRAGPASPLRPAGSCAAPGKAARRPSPPATTPLRAPPKTATTLVTGLPWPASGSLRAMAPARTSPTTRTRTTRTRTTRTRTTRTRMTTRSPAGSPRPWTSLPATWTAPGPGPSGSPGPQASRRLRRTATQTHPGPARPPAPPWRCRGGPEIRASSRSTRNRPGQRPLPGSDRSAYGASRASSGSIARRRPPSRCPPRRPCRAKSPGPVRRSRTHTRRSRRGTRPSHGGRRHTRPSQAGRRDRRPVGTLGRARVPPSSRTSPGRATSATRSAPPSSPSRSSSPTSETTPTHGMTVGLPPRRPYGLVPRALPGAPTPGSRATPCFLSRRCQRVPSRASAAAGSAPRRWRSPLSSSSPWPSSRWPC